MGGFLNPHKVIAFGPLFPPPSPALYTLYALNCQKPQILSPSISTTPLSQTLKIKTSPQGLRGQHGTH